MRGCNGGRWVISAPWSALKFRLRTPVLFFSAFSIATLPSGASMYRPFHNEGSLSSPDYAHGPSEPVRLRLKSSNLSGYCEESAYRDLRGLSFEFVKARLSTGRIVSVLLENLATERLEWDPCRVLMASLNPEQALFKIDKLRELAKEAVLEEKGIVNDDPLTREDSRQDVSVE